MINFEDVAPSALQARIKEFAQQDIPTFLSKGKRICWTTVPYALELRLPQEGDFGQDVIFSAIAAKLSLTQVTLVLQDDLFPEEEDIDFWFENNMPDAPTLLVLPKYTLHSFRFYKHIYTIFRRKAYTTPKGKRKKLPPLLLVGCWRQDAPNTLSQAFPDFMEPFDLIPMPRAIAEREIKEAFSHISQHVEVFNTLCDLAVTPTRTLQLIARLKLYLTLHQINEGKIEFPEAFLTDFLTSCTQTKSGLLPEELLVLKTIRDGNNESDLSLTSKDNYQCICEALSSLQVCKLIMTQREASNQKPQGGLSLDEFCKSLSNALTYTLTPTGEYCLRQDFSIYGPVKEVKL